MHRTLAFAAAAVLSAGPFAPVIAQESPSGPAPVKVAAVLSLTGPYATIGRQEQAALQIATRVVNSTGGINGRQLDLIVEDDQSAPGTAVTDARWLIENVQPAAILGGSYEATCSAMREVTEPASVLQYCLSGAQTGNSSFFASFPAPGRAFGDLPAAWMVTQHLDNVAIIASDDRAGRLYTSAIEAAAAGERLHVAGAETFSTPAAAAASLDRLLQHHPGVIYVGTAVTGAATVLAYLHAHHINTPVWLVSADATRSAARGLAAVLPDGPVFSSTTKLAVYDHLPQNDTQRVLLRQFIDAYARYQRGQTPDIFAVIAADAAEFVVAALRSDGGIGGMRLVQSLERTPRAPGLYSWYHFGPNRHNGTELPGVIVRFSPSGTLDYVNTLDDARIPEFAHVWLHAARPSRMRISDEFRPR